MRRRRPINWLEFGICTAILFVVLILIRGCDVKAEWVTIDRFGGLNTDINASHLKMGEARYAVGVYIRDGELVNGDYLKYCGMSYVSTEPCRVLGRLSLNNGVLFDNGFLQWYDATGDSSYIMQDTVVVGSDTARGIEFTALADTLGDLLILPDLDTTIGKFALSTLEGLQITPFGGALKFVPIRAIYSEKYIRLRDTGLVVNGTQYFIKIAGSVIGNRNLTSLSYPDTTLFFNGQQMTVMTNDNIGQGQTYVTAGPPDTTLIRYITADDVDTNKCGMLRFKGHAPQFRKLDVGKFLYPQDTSCVYRGSMFMIVRADSVAGYDSVNYCVLADTATKNRLMNVYKAAPIRIQVFTRPAMKEVARSGITPKQMYSSIYGVKQNDSLVLYNPLCSAQYIYSQTWNTFGAMFGAWKDSVRADKHALENDFWEFREQGGPGWPPSRWGARVIFHRVAGNTVTYGSGTLTQDVDDAVRITAIYDSLHTTIPTYGFGHVGFPNGVVVYRAVSRFPIVQNDTSGVTAVTSHWTIAENHRARAFYSGNHLKTPWDSSVMVKWSPLDHYDTLGGAGSGIERFEGDAEVVGLSSMGSNLIFYRRRPPNAIISLSGFSDEDFYFSPLSTGVGAVSDQSICRNPLDEADYFPNNLGLWWCDGSSVTKVETNCESIFQDSINWAAETQICGVVFDNHYWLAAPFGTSTINNRFLTIDLVDGAVTFVPNPGTWVPCSMKLLRIPGYQDRVFAGAADTGMLMEIIPPKSYAETGDVLDQFRNYGAAGEWRSGWMDFGDPTQRKRINGYGITYQGDWSRFFYGGLPDSIIVSFYKDFSETAVWSDRITFGGTTATTMTTSRRMPVPGAVQGHHLSFGIRFTGADSLASDVLVSRFAMDVVPVGTVKPR
jgi:hypothetical protein